MKGCQATLNASDGGGARDGVELKVMVFDRRLESCRNPEEQRAGASPETGIGGPATTTRRLFIKCIAQLQDPCPFPMDFLKSAVASAISKGPAFGFTFGDRVDVDQSIWTLHNGTKRVWPGI